jgi:hypothetical protein
MCHVFLVWQSILYITQPSGVKKSMIISRWVIIQKSCREDPCFFSFCSILLAVVNDETCMGGRSMSVIFLDDRSMHGRRGQVIHNWANQGRRVAACPLFFSP